MYLFLMLFSLLFFDAGALYARLVYPKTMQEFKQLYPEANIIECLKDYAFSYPEFPLYPEHKENHFPNQGYHADISVMEVPNSIAVVHPEGYIFVNDCFMKETQIKTLEPFRGQPYIEQPDLQNVTKVHGRVVMLEHLYSWVYGLFVFDILSALALLELYNIDYDYVCLPYGIPYQKEALEIWGIDPKKIIPMARGLAIQADVIILPASISQNKGKMVFNINYFPDILIRYVREKMLTGVKKMQLNVDLPEKVFISRKDASHSRKIPNEDEVFALFKPLGYKQIEFSKLTMAEKIAVANNAKCIVTFMGSGSTNIMFAQPDVRVYEIQQEYVEATFFYLAHIVGLKHFDILNATTLNDLLYGPPFAAGRVLSIELVKEFIKNHPEL